MVNNQNQWESNGSLSMAHHKLPKDVYNRKLFTVIIADFYNIRSQRSIRQLV